jgi:hypothetical protein
VITLYQFQACGFVGMIGPGVDIRLKSVFYFCHDTVMRLCDVLENRGSVTFLRKGLTLIRRRQIVESTAVVSR